MRVNIVGAGPAGLYAAILIKRHRPDADVQVLERNPADSTWGFGVVFSDQALEFLRADDPDTADLIEPHMQRWANIAVVHRGQRIEIDGVGFAGIGRLALLDLLRRRAAVLGATLRFETTVHDVAALADADLLIGADGLNSVVRASADFGAVLTERSNRFAWYGTERPFDALTQTFIDTVHGPMNAHHYAYAPGRSTFIIEMSAATYARSDFARTPEPHYRAACERFFAESLGGSRLTPNNSNWRRFPDLHCARWHAGRRVLVGDALHTAHFSIGSGTRLALEDVIALVAALAGHDWDVCRALPAFQARRQPILDKLLDAAHRSAHWYEAFDTHMALPPLPFALSYIRRAGRLDGARLRALAPTFTARLEAAGIDLELAC